MDINERRRLLKLVAASAASLATLESAVGQQRRPVRPSVVRTVEPIEELMHQHGVLRRCLRVLDAGAGRLSAGQPFPRPVLGAAQLFREFGNEQHERKLEEAYVFPDLRRLDPGGGTNFERLTDTLVTQHRRSEEILRFLLEVAGRDRLREADIQPLVQGLGALRTMYAYHTAVEESLVFPTWKSTIDEARYAQVHKAFAAIGAQQYGREGIAGAVKQISAIEAALKLGDLAAVTAPAPPSAGNRGNR